MERLTPAWCKEPNSPSHASSLGPLMPADGAAAGWACYSGQTVFKPGLRAGPPQSRSNVLLKANVWSCREGGVDGLRTQASGSFGRAALEEMLETKQVCDVPGLVS